MSRRDTIIISVLVNAVLLAVLFTTAITKNSVTEPNMASNTLLAETTKELLLVDASKEETLSNEIDQIDVQKQFVYCEENDKNSELPIVDKDIIPINKEEEKIVYKLPEVAKQPQEKKAETILADTYEITIKGGDTLERIARSNHVKVSDITALNNLPNSFLRVGQKLLIPKNLQFEKTNTQPVKTEVKKPFENQEFYIVKVGDNPYTIAIKHSIKPNDLLKLNNLDEKKARRLKPGDKLRIR